MRNRVSQYRPSMATLVCLLAGVMFGTTLASDLIGPLKLETVAWYMRLGLIIICAAGIAIVLRLVVEVSYRAAHRRRVQANIADARRQMPR